MKTQITSLSEAENELATAIEHLSRVQVFMNKFQGVVDQLGVIREKLGMHVDHTAPNPSHLSLAQRVLVIMRQLNCPVMPKAVALEYSSRNWPAPRSGTVYDAVNATMSYLLHRKKILSRSDEGYFVKPEPLGESDGEKSKKRRVGVIRHSRARDSGTATG